MGMVRAAVVAALALGGSAEAAELKVVDVKAYVFLERAGKLSENILGGPALVDAPRGGAPGESRRGRHGLAPGRVRIPQKRTQFPWHES